MRVASLDLGSNTFLLLVSDVSEGKIAKIYKDETRVVRLGEKLSETGKFADGALKRAEKVLSEYRDLINRTRAVKVLAVATSAARDAQNREQLLAIARAKEIPLEIISGEKEAALSFAGTTYDHPSPDDCCVIDIGGGSTEFICRAKGQTEGVSVNIGSVRGYDMFGKSEPIGKAAKERVLEWANEKIGGVTLANHQAKNELIAVAGTPTALACLVEEKDFNEKTINGFLLNEKTIEKWVDRLFDLSPIERENLRGMPTGRGDVLPIGAAILLQCMRALKKTELFVSTRGVRHGLALSL